MIMMDMTEPICYSVSHISSNSGFISRKVNQCISHNTRIGEINIAMISSL